MNAVISEATPLWLISANDLLLGDVVYLAEQNEWTRDLGEASCFDSQPAAEQARLAAEDQHDKVVGPIVVGASYRTDEKALMLNHFRDRFRESGPTHREGFSRVPSAERSLSNQLADTVTGVS